MKRKNYLYTLAAVLIVVIAGVYAIDSNSQMASVVNLPDFTGNTEVSSAEKKPVATLSEFNDAIVDIADQATPTVVTVRVTQTVEAPENPFSRFFGNPRGGQQPEERQRSGLGSGVIVSNDGYILTNNHVVEDADEITIDLNNGDSYDGTVIGRDPQTDIAVVKIEATDLKSMAIGNSDDVRVGEMVLAIGSPLGDRLANSVSMGIISAKERAIGILQNAGGYETFLQTDAAINPGNSGGALVNMDGKLVGINSAIASRTGGSDGIGFAVPSNLAKSIMESLITDGEVQRGFLGLGYGGKVDRTMAQALGIDKAQGIIVGSVKDGGPADEAGVKEGDVVQTLNGKRIDNWIKFRSAIGTSKPGDKVQLGVIQDENAKEVTVTLGVNDQEQGRSVQPNKQDKDMQKNLGFGVDELTDRMSQQLELESGQKGIIVTNMNPNSNAAQKGLQRGDVITKVNKQSVNSLSDFEKAINSLADEENPVVLLQVLSRGNNQYIAFEL
jgi:serine protease Do